MAIRSTAPSTPPTCSAPLPLITTFWPMVMADGMAISPGRETPGAISIGRFPSVAVATGVMAADSLAIVLKFGALEPSEWITAGASGCSRSWISVLSNVGSAVSTTWLVISCFNSARAAIPITPRTTRIAP